MADFRDAIEEVRNRVNVLDVISEYVTIKHAGKSHKGLCPFHPEKTPSFTVREEFQTWHCFGCGEHGDVFSFLMKIENLTFQETLERLARRAGVELGRYQDKKTSRRDVLAGINAFAASYYSALLKKTPNAQEYLNARGLAQQTIEQFQLGWAAPAWDGLRKFLSAKGVSDADAEEAGLIIRGERGFYDRFRHRVVFPILDIQERVIGFGGRAMGDDQPKYLNSPETPLFSKTRSVYGLHLARKSIADKGYAIVVEGYMDVIAAHQAGFSNCIATLGTALTQEHIGILSRYTQKIVLAYDADSAGMKAALRGAEMFDDSESEVRIAKLPVGDDPDSLLRKGGVSVFAAALESALPVIDYRLESLRGKYDLSGSAGRASMLKEAVRILSEVPSVIERERHIKGLAGLARWHPNYETGTTLAEDHIRKEVEQFVSRRQHQGVGKRIRPGGMPKPLSAAEKAEKYVLRVLMRGEVGAEAIHSSLSPEHFAGETSRKAATIIFEKFGSKRGIYLPELLDIADSDTSRFLSELVMQEESEPVNEIVVQDYIALIKNQNTRKKRTSEIVGPYIRGGIIDPEDWRKEQTPERFREYLKKTGKLPETGGQ